MTNDDKSVHQLPAEAIDHLGDIIKAKFAVDIALLDFINLLNHPSDGRILDHRIMEGGRSIIRRVYRDDGTGKYDLHIEHIAKITPVVEKIRVDVFRIPLCVVAEGDEVSDMASSDITGIEEKDVPKGVDETI